MKKHPDSADVAMDDNTPVISALLDGGDEFATLVKEYIDHLSRLLDELEALLKNQQWDDLRKEIHDLKGGGGGFGYPQITELAREIEIALIDADYEMLPALFGRLRKLERRIALGRPA
jgi:HPt (histidine-containing phosphotransfer) domain-containing protein